MKRWATGAALATVAAAAAAQGVSGRLQMSRDSDGLRESLASAAYRGAQGFGLKAGTLHYNAPGWRQSGALLAATYQRSDAAVRLDASLGVAQIAERSHAVGALDASWPVASASSLGVSLERDLVNSVAGIDHGVAFTSLALVADHAFGERFNVGIAAGSTQFSNDNRRPLLRTRWNFELVPAYGLNAYLKTRSYRNSAPYRPEYFSPERLNEVSAGLSSRLRVGERVVLGAGADAGTQHTESGSRRIWSIALRLASPRGEAVQWSIALEASTAAGVSQLAASNAYRYASAVAQLNLPF